MPRDGAGYDGRPRQTVYEVVTEAIADFAVHGFDSQERLDRWLERIRAVAKANMMSDAQATQVVTDSLAAIYRQTVERGGLLKMHKGVASYTLDRIKPKLRAELDRRILASANLIKLNRAAAIDTTLRRFSGWSTSIPVGGSDVIDKVEVKTDIRKSLTQLSFVERRVAIDQGHKLSSAISSIVATDGGAIAGEWHSHFRQSGYHFRPDHKVRDGKFYVVRGCWAIEKGLIKAVYGYTDDITQPSEEVYCRCAYRYVYSLRDLPIEMLTDKGKSELARVRAA